ncbi:MAG: aminoglycoside adenylyltransferase domain-containing protein [Anaerolineae bacterium]|jgi:hypothetical protein
MPQADVPEVDALLGELRTQVQATLGDELLGLYLYGSMVTGGYTVGISDVDLLAVTTSTLGDATLQALHCMHETLQAAYPAWRDRIEVAYVSFGALQTFRQQTSTIAVISPGEPFHTVEAGRAWLVNWWVVRHQGVDLLGPPASELIPPIDTAEFLAIVREHAREWPSWVQEMREHRGGQAYAILTLCRALYASTHGDQTSKQEAAAWAQRRYPQWAPLIADALLWRLEPAPRSPQHRATYTLTERFVRFAAAEIADGGLEDSRG